MGRCKAQADILYYLPNVGFRYVLKDNEQECQCILNISPESIKKYGKNRRSIGSSTKSSGDWFSLVKAHAETWDDIKLIMAYTREEDIVNVVCIYDYYNAPLKDVHLNEEKVNKEWYNDFLNQVKQSRTRYLNHYLSEWTESNEKLYQCKCTGRYRGKHDVQSFL